MFIYDNGIKLDKTKLWLDANRRVATSFVSHAHMDHACRHQRILSTEPTYRLFKKRVGKTKTIILGYGEIYEFDGYKIQLFPAGHILGSAQILIESNGMRLLYSGDFNTIKNATAAPIEIPESDILIMESTFGKPEYRFPDRHIVEQQLIDFAGEALKQNQVPVVAGYALGKSQEAMKILGDAGFKLSVHGSVAAFAKIYEEFGVKFGDWQKYSRTDVEGKVLIIPRIAIQSRMVKRLERKRIVFLTGWAVNPHLRSRYNIDEVLPLSDHCDFDGLIDYAKKVKAKKIFTTHGFKDFPKYLTRMGFNAQLLNKSNQLTLF